MTYGSGHHIWNNAKLAAYASKHPEVLAFRHKSKPSISLRWSKAFNQPCTTPDK